MKYSKLSLTLFALLGIAFGAEAGDVKIWGRIDTGLSYVKTDLGSQSKDSLSMSSGVMTANRVGIRGEEQLTDDTSVGFLLEMGFNSDSGEMKTDGTLFDRGSWLYMKNNSYGELAAGRIGTFRSTATEHAVFVTGKRINPFVNGWDTIGNVQYMMPWYGIPMRDNMLSYISPSMNGLKVRLQYAMGDGNVNENKPSTDRYAAGALTYDGKGIELMAMLDTVNENSSGGNQHDSWSLTVGGNIETTFATFYGWAQYFENVDQIRPIPGMTFGDYPLFRGLDEINGYSVSLGLKKPLPVGRAFASIGFMDADYDDNVTAERAATIGSDLKRFNLSLGWNYNLSKRTFLYAGGTYYRDQTEFTNAGVHFKDPEAFQLSIGIDHSF